MYYLLFLSVCWLYFSSLLNRKLLSKYFYYSIALLFIFFCGTRFASNDYYNYARIFENITDISYISWPNIFLYVDIVRNVYIDSGFAGLAIVFKNLGLSFEYFIFFISFLSIYISFSLFRLYSPNFYFSIIVYMAIILFWKDLGQIRNGLASSICLLSVCYFSKRNFFRSAVFWIFSIGIHFVSVAAIVVPFLVLVRNRYFWLGLIIFSYVIAINGGILLEIILVLDSIVDDKRLMGHYSGSVQVGPGPFGFTFLNLLILSLLIIFYMPLLRNESRVLDVVSRVFLFSVCVRFVSVDYSIIGGRFFDLLGASVLPLLIPCLCKVVRSKPESIFIYGYVTLLLPTWFYLSERIAAPYLNIFWAGF